MSSRTPIEIWRIILKYSIYVPLFLDSDPVESYGVDCMRKYFYEAGYWHAERTRNSLHRVCRAWSILLRLDLDDGFGCQCEEFCKDQVKECWEMIENIWKTALVFPQSADAGGVAPWKVEVIKGRISEEVAYYGTLKERAPNLRSMISQSLDSVPSSTDLPSALTLFTTDFSEPRGCFDINSMIAISVLHIVVSSLDIPMEKENFLFLGHLSIDVLMIKRS